MNDLKVIGHRGIRGMGTENTPDAFKAAAGLNVDAIEFDVQRTKDNVLVVCHAKSSPRKIYGIDQPLITLPYEAVRQHQSKAGGTMPTLEDVMRTDIGKPVIMDIKDADSAPFIHQTLEKIGNRNEWMAASLYPEVLAALKKFYPGLDTSLQIYSRPLKRIKTAREIGASHITLVLYLLNPLTYFLARRADLKILVYQNYASVLLTWRWFVWLLRLFYPKIAVFSDRPDKITDES